MNTSALTSRYFYTQPGIRIHAKVCGPEGAPTLLFVHGFPEFWYAWRKVLPAFAGAYRCVAIDLRGFNLSSQPQAPSAYKPALLLADLQSVIAQLGGKVRAVVAHDWGGALCWGLAAAHPELMEKLVVLNAPHTLTFAKALAHDAEQIAASQYMNALRQPGFEKTLSADNFERLFSMVEGLSALGTEEQEQYRACWRHGLTGGCNLYRASPLFPDSADTPGRMATVLASLRSEDFGVRVPTQIIWGTSDRALRPVLLEGIENHVPTLRIDRIEGAGHWIAHSHSGAVIAAMAEFLGA